jgi:hypothetical protein
LAFYSKLVIEDLDLFSGIEEVFGRIKSLESWEVSLFFEEVGVESSSWLEISEL